MAGQGILVEINLTSSEAILGITGARSTPSGPIANTRFPLPCRRTMKAMARIDLTHEYQRAVESYDLGYDDLKYLSRNALAYSFLPGKACWNQPGREKW